MACEKGKKFGLVGIADRYIETTLDDDGILDSISYMNDENFNFAYDVVDVMAKKCPDKLAMLHVSREGRERHFTFRDMAKYSNKAANYFSYLGIKKGYQINIFLLHRCIMII